MFSIPTLIAAAAAAAVHWVLSEPDVITGIHKLCVAAGVISFTSKNGMIAALQLKVMTHYQTTTTTFHLLLLLLKLLLLLLLVLLLVLLLHVFLLSRLALIHLLQHGRRPNCCLRLLHHRRTGRAILTSNASTN